MRQIEVLIVVRAIRTIRTKSNASTMLIDQKLIRLRMKMDVSVLYFLPIDDADRRCSHSRVTFPVIHRRVIMIGRHMGNDGVSL